MTDPDVTPEPEQTHIVTGTVTVTYGDGATQQLPVSFTVESSALTKTCESSFEPSLKLNWTGYNFSPAVKVSTSCLNTRWGWCNTTVTGKLYS